MNLDKYYLYINECRTKIYDISKCHVHHIIPKFMGGTDLDVNKIQLSYEDHYNAHIVLANCFEEGSSNYSGNIRSAQYILRWITDPVLHERRFSGIKRCLTSINKQKNTIRYKMENISNYAKNLSIIRSKNALKQWEDVNLTNRRKESIKKSCNDPEYLIKLSNRIKNDWKDDIKRNKRLERLQSPEFRKKQSLNFKRINNDPQFQKKRDMIRTCPHCSTSMKGSIIFRYHFDRCKHVINNAQKGIEWVEDNLIHRHRN